MASSRCLRRPRYALVALGSLLLVGLVGWLVAGQLLRPLRLLREAAERISHTDLSLRIPVSGSDDVSELTRTVNAMLDRLESGFEAQQRFLDDAEGSGLGLAIVTAIAEAHGGRVVLDSSPGHGATFTLVLPVGPWMA
jgi:signal transduction histidine kinase